MAEFLFEEVTTAMVAIRIPPDIQQAIEKKVAAAICLMCDEPLNGESPKRGCHPRCYQAFIRAKAAKKTDEKRLLKEGRLLTRAIRGRRPISAKVKQVLEG